MALSPITFISCIPASASTSLFYNNLSLKVATALALTVVHCSHYNARSLNGVLHEFAFEERVELQLDVKVILIDIFKILLNFVKSSLGFTRSALERP